MEGATKAMGWASPNARSNGKLWALRSWITSIPKLARFKTSAHVGTGLPWLSRIDSLKLNPFRLKDMVLMPNDANQIPITGHAARKKWSDRELLKEAY